MKKLRLNPSLWACLFIYFKYQSPFSFVSNYHLLFYISWCHQIRTFIFTFPCRDSKRVFYYVQIWIGTRKRIMTLDSRGWRAVAAVTSHFATTNSCRQAVQGRRSLLCVLSTLLSLRSCWTHVTWTIWPAQPGRFRVWPFMANVCQCLSGVSNSFSPGATSALRLLSKGQVWF